MTGLVGYEEATSSSASLRLAAASTVGAWACTEKARAARIHGNKRRSIVRLLVPIYSTDYIGSAERAPQRAQLGGDRASRARLNAAIALQHLAAESGQHGAAALGAALGRVHQRRGEIAVHRLDQAPGAGVAHLHATAGGGDGAGVADVLEQLRFARAEGASPAQDDAQAERGMAVGAGHDAIIAAEKKRAACAALKVLPQLEL